MRYEWSECIVSVEATRRGLCPWPRQEQTDWTGKVWYGDSMANIKHGTDGEEIRSWNGATSYAAKYCAKVSDVRLAGAGRVWGVHNRTALPTQKEDQAQRIEMPVKTAFRVVRTLRRYIRANRGENHRRGKKTTTGRVFTCNPQKWIDFALHEIDRDCSEEKHLLRKAEMSTRLESHVLEAQHRARQRVLYDQRVGLWTDEIERACKARRWDGQNA